MTAQEFISQCTPNGNNLIFPDIKLDRKVYDEVKKLLEGCMGKWNKKINGFTFKSDAASFQKRVLDGEKVNIKKEFQFFETPVEIGRKMVEYLEVPTMGAFSILEPSAGRGNLICAIRQHNPYAKIDYCELMPENQDFLKERFEVCTFVGADFLETKFSKKYDYIVANPPFANNQDIDHILKMYSLLKPNSSMAVICSKHWENSSRKKEKDFSDWLVNKIIFKTTLPSGTFSDTKIETNLLILQKNEVELVLKNPITITGYFSEFVEIELPSSLYGKTTGSGKTQDVLQKGFISCGDGTDYKLTKDELQFILLKSKQ